MAILYIEGSLGAIAVIKDHESPLDDGVLMVLSQAEQQHAMTGNCIKKLICVVGPFSLASSHLGV